MMPPAAVAAAPSSGWNALAPFPTLPVLQPSTPLPLSPAFVASAATPSSVPENASLSPPPHPPPPSSPPPPTFAPMMAFYEQAQAWTHAARMSLEPASPPSSPPPIAFATQRPSSKRSRRAAQPISPRADILIKPEPEDPALALLSLSAGAPTEPVAADPEAAKLQSLLRQYEGMMEERAESWRRIERLREDSARFFSGAGP